MTLCQVGHGLPPPTLVAGAPPKKQDRLSVALFAPYVHDHSRDLLRERRLSIYEAMHGAYGQQRNADPTLEGWTAASGQPCPPPPSAPLAPSSVQAIPDKSTSPTAQQNSASSATSTPRTTRGRRNSSSRLSAVSPQEKQMALAAIASIFNAHIKSDAEGMTAEQFVQMATHRKLLDGKRLTRTECLLIFERVKLGPKKRTIDLERFTEGFRQICKQKEVAFMELAVQAAEVALDGGAAVAGAEDGRSENELRARAAAELRKRSRGAPR